MRVIFRADASVKIGSGHVMRCLTLAQQLRKAGVEVAFMCREHPGNLCDYLESFGYTVFRLSLDGADAHHDGPPLRHAGWLGASQHSDALACLQALASSGSVDWLVVDHYALDLRWETPLRTVSANIMVIDDLADRPHACDLLLDQNLYADMAGRYCGLTPQHCRQLLGPDYALLRPEFKRARQNLRRRNASADRILVFMGGADAENATALALDAIELLDRPDLGVDVVLGGSNPHAETIKRRCESMANATCYVQVSNLAELMSFADLAIGAGGVNTWERCALGLPTIAIAVAENQVPIAMSAANHGASLYAGELRLVDKYRLAGLLRATLASAEALRAMSECAARLVDAEGTERVAQQLLNA